MWYLYLIGPKIGYFSHVRFYRIRSLNPWNFSLLSPIQSLDEIMMKVQLQTKPIWNDPTPTPLYPLLAWHKHLSVYWETGSLIINNRIRKTTWDVPVNHPMNSQSSTEYIDFLHGYSVYLFPTQVSIQCKFDKRKSLSFNSYLEINSSKVFASLKLSSRHFFLLSGRKVNIS